MKWDTIQPRLLKYRSHYKLYVWAFYLISFFMMSFWCYRLTHLSFQALWETYSSELFINSLFFICAGCSYFFWIRKQMSRSVQVFPDHLILHSPGSSIQLNYSEVESVNIVCWSIFYLKMKTGYKYYFNSSLDRVDYIWDGIYEHRPDLLSKEIFEE